MLMAYSFAAKQNRVLEMQEPLCIREKSPQWRAVEHPRTLAQVTRSRVDARAITQVSKLFC